MLRFEYGFSLLPAVSASLGTAPVASDDLSWPTARACEYGTPFSKISSKNLRQTHRYRYQTKDSVHSLDLIHEIHRSLSLPIHASVQGWHFRPFVVDLT